MGCDFYTYYVLCIEYEKDGIQVYKEEVNNTREKHYFWHTSERDEDFEEWEDYMKRSREERQLEIDHALCMYPALDLYKDKKWLCVQIAQDKYKDLLKKHKIDEDSVLRIWKEGDYQMR